MERAGCLSIARGNCVKTVQDKEELGWGVGEERNINGNSLILTSFPPSSLPFNLQISLICRRHPKMLCRAALSPLVRSPGWSFVLLPRAIAAISRLCMYERKHTFLIMLVSMSLGMPMLFPMLKGKSPH